MSQPHGSASVSSESTQARPPRVVLFRANAIDADSRAKKFSLTLARLGYDVHVLSAEEPGAPTADRWLGPVRVHAVIMTHAFRDVHRLVAGARRRRQFRVVDWTPVDEYVTQVRELTGWSRVTRRRADALRSPDPEAPERARLWRPRWLVVRLAHSVVKALVVTRKARWRVQWAINVGYRVAWREWDRRRLASTLLTTTRGVLPEVEDYAASFARVLDLLEPDIIHVHHPLVLGTAVRAARRRRAAGKPCVVVYDARENFAGIPRQEQGHLRRHAALVREEARYIRRAAAVITVSEPIADVLRHRYRLPARPAVVLNAPILGQDRDVGPTVREAAGLPAGVPLAVYSGAVSRARGIDTLIRALVHLADPAGPGGGVHAVVVPVPFPHPHTPELLELAVGLGVADRVHFVPSVGQDRLLHYLSGADVAVMPLRTGSDNIEQALPNKLFENLHAGLTMVTSDAALMQRFVTEHDLGEVYHDPDDADLAAAIRRALANPRDPHSAHRQDLIHRYSWQGQEEVIRGVYASLRPPPRPEGIALPQFGSLTVTSDLPPAVGTTAVDATAVDATAVEGMDGAEVPVPVGTPVPEPVEEPVREPSRDRVAEPARRAVRAAGAGPARPESAKPPEPVGRARYRVPGNDAVQRGPAPPSSQVSP
ncbi:MAG TPA: glycosyltransferase [Kineosporiaceae bacterium]